MKFLIGCFLTAFLGFIYNYSYAQPGRASVKGVVFTENHTPANGATITLLRSADSTIVKTTVSNLSGQFQFTVSKAGNYIILTHKIGYQNFYSKTYYLTTGKIIDVGEITLIALNSELNEVSINGKRDYIKIYPDKTVLNIDRSILASGNNVFDILSTAPGVRLADNQVLLKGGQRALIAINGRPVGMLSDEQLSDLLKSYQSDMISQIEIINNPSAKYDAAGGGVINIILKKGKDTGFRANIIESAAAGQDYKVNTGINMNYRTSKFNFFGGYNFNDNKTPRLLDIDRVVGPEALDLNYNSTTYLKGNNFSLGTDYNINPNQTIGVLLYGYYNSIGIDKHNVTNIYNSGVADSDILTKSHINRAITNLNYNLNYKGSFGKNGATTFLADVDYSTYVRRSDELLQNSSYTIPKDSLYDLIYYRDSSPSDIKVWSEKMDFSQALSQNSTLSVGVKNSSVNSDNRIDFDQKIDSANASFEPIAALTDHFVYKERVTAGYVNFVTKINKTGLSFGLRAEQTKSSGVSYHPDRTSDTSYFNLFPNFQLTQLLDKDNQLILNYNRRISRPNYQDLNPFVAYIDQYSYSTGNPYLKPEYTDNYSITDIIKNKFKITLGITIVKNYIATIYQQVDSTKVSTTTSSNIGTNKIYEAEFNIPFDITNWWNVNLYADASYERYIFNADSASKSTYDIEFKLTQDFIINKGLRAELYASYDSPTFQGIKQYQEQATARAGISQSLFHDNGSIRLSVTDIFNSDIYRYTSNYQNLDLTGREKPGTRFFIATFTYRFGKKTVKGAGHRVGGNIEEQNRLSGSKNEN